MPQTRQRPRTANPGASTEQVGQTTASVATPADVAQCPRVGCVPDDRCPEHRDAQPERFGDLAAAFLVQLARPRLRLIKGGRRW
ncbi:hypothetical protein ACQRWP_23840 [Micromonospora trifolii]|uniref:hypothetical protein n=1 Tax=Micromonospora trifolii TaxID=2911208 RepID=UPI003D2EC24F